jgi:hypothetical protein
MVREPRVVAARGDAENATHRLHAELTSMGLDELVRQPLSTKSWELQYATQMSGESLSPRGIC